MPSGIINKGHEKKKKNLTKRQQQKITKKLEENEDQQISASIQRNLYTSVRFYNHMNVRTMRKIEGFCITILIDCLDLITSPDKTRTTRNKNRFH